MPQHVIIGYEQVKEQQQQQQQPQQQQLLLCHMKLTWFVVYEILQQLVDFNNKIEITLFACFFF